VIEMISRHIISLGVEIECGIDKNEFMKLKRYVARNKLYDYFYADSDCSVNVSTKEIYDAELKYWNTDLEKIFKFAKYLYNNCKIKTNNSCGLHIHIRLNDEKYSILACQKGIDYFINAYSKKFKSKSKYMNRLTNSYCNAKNLTEATVNNQVYGYGTRYRAINFVSLSERQKTLEFRIFPHQTTYSEFEQTIKWFIKTIDNLYRKHQVIKSSNLSLAKYKRQPTFKSETIYIHKLKPIKLSLGEQLATFGSIFTKQQNKKGAVVSCAK